MAQKKSKSGGDYGSPEYKGHDEYKSTGDYTMESEMVSITETTDRRFSNPNYTHQRDMQRTAKRAAKEPVEKPINTNPSDGKVPPRSRWGGRGNVAS